MKKKIFGFLCVTGLLCSILSGCNTSNDKSGTPDFSFSMNFLQDEYEEEYNHYEKKLEVTEDSSEISISGQSSSGKIDIQIISTDGEDKQLYNYEIEGASSDKIKLGEEHTLEWTAIVDIYKDTEGSFEITVK